MSLPTISVYSTSNNINVLRLTDRNQPVLLNALTKVELTLDTGTVIDSVQNPTVITWSTGTSTTGLIYLRLGELFFASRAYIATLITYDTVNTLGIYWGKLRIIGIEALDNG
jgi:hypothetical protein